MLTIRVTLERNELVSTFFPTRERDRQAFIETLLSWEQEASSLKAQIEAAEAIHNQSVSLLYGIHADRLTVLRRFLTHF
jgi:hypothetical protein